MTEQMVHDFQDEWTITSGYPKYEVSNFGRIRNVKTGRILKTDYIEVVI